MNKTVPLLIGMSILVSLGMYFYISRNKSNTKQTNTTSKYSGQEALRITSLTETDIVSLETGTGDALGGLAKPTELSGYPGPRHVLDLQKEMTLTPEQVLKTQEVYDTMKASAVSTGKLIIAIETQLNDGLRNKMVDNTQLKELLSKSAAHYGELRFIHNSTHLAMINILTKAQIQKYNSLRGYDGADPCANVPQGHDTDMWKKHNGCK